MTTADVPAGDVYTPPAHPVVAGHVYDEAGATRAVCAWLFAAHLSVLRQVQAPPVEQDGRLVGRIIDVLAVGTGADMGSHMTAVEVKTTRQDFRADVRNPDKRAPWLGVAQFYYAAPAGVIPHGEVPPLCGLLEITRRVHPNGGQYDAVEVVTEPPAGTRRRSGLPGWLLERVVRRAAALEARVEGWSADLSPLDAMHRQYEEAVAHLQRTDARADRERLNAESWRAVAAAQGAKVPCRSCGAPVVPSRIRAGAILWRHAQPHLTRDCPANAGGVQPVGIEP